VGQELADRGVTDSSAKVLLDIFDETRRIVDEGKDINRTIVSNLINIVNNQVLGDIGQVLKLTEGLPVQIDPSLARGLSYYTGTIIEINVPDLAGSLGGGGRYDGLIGMFGKEQIPACGFSLGLERILHVMDERGMFPSEIAESRAADVMVTIWNEDSISESLRLAGELRDQGLRVLLYPEADKLGKQLKYADSIKIPWVCVLGESEIAEHKVSLKNMKTGEQKITDLNEIVNDVSMART
jgi:histidyl-tRNA synthetase